MIKFKEHRLADIIKQRLIHHPDRHASVTCEEVPSRPDEEVGIRFSFNQGEETQNNIIAVVADIIHGIEKEFHVRIDYKDFVEDGVQKLFIKCVDVL